MLDILYCLLHRPATRAALNPQERSTIIIHKLCRHNRDPQSNQAHTQARQPATQLLQYLSHTSAGSGQNYTKALKLLHAKFVEIQYCSLNSLLADCSEEGSSRPQALREELQVPSEEGNGQDGAGRHNQEHEESEEEAAVISLGDGAQVLGPAVVAALRNGGV